jgi:adenine-specific DNA-methyltransferase
MPTAQPLPLLTKRHVVSAVRCPRRVWFEITEPRAPELTASRDTRLMGWGRRVKLLAREQVPGGVSVDDGPAAECAARTQAALQSGLPIYGGAFVHDGVFAPVDIIVPTGTGCRLIIVKMANSVPAEAIEEAAVLLDVVRGAGVQVRGIDVMHLNPACRQLDSAALFTSVDITDAAEMALPPLRLAREVVRGEAFIQGARPEVAVGPQCETPSPCEFLSRCRGPLPNHHVSELAGVARTKVAAMLASGVSVIPDIPSSTLLPVIAARQRRAVIANRVIVERSLPRMLSLYKGPIGYLDFETVQLPIPRWPGCSPFQQVPVQFSFDLQRDDASLEHHEWIASGSADPRPSIAQALVEACRGAASIVAYSATFERERINELMTAVPSLREELRNIRRRIVDLLPVVRNNVYHPEFHGSFSIKKVLPALLGTNPYNGLEVANGTAAMGALEQLLFDTALSDAARAKLRADLLRYCALDTKAMVLLHERLTAMASERAKPSDPAGLGPSYVTDSSEAENADLRATPFHGRFWAQSLLLKRPVTGAEGLSRSIGNARVDLNPHQVDAATFALRSPYSKGVMLADEVGLGKTIEAAIVLAQKWAERRRRILLIVPATLRKQWQNELEQKFFLPSVILESKTANDLIKKGTANPFRVEDRIVICSYQFVYAKRQLVRDVEWDLVVIDEAHRLRSIYKGTKTAEGIVESIRPAKKLLLTATPLQNSLLELYGLVGILDPDVFGSQDAFQTQFMNPVDVEERDDTLRQRIQHVCKRTLRRQVLEYVNFTARFTHTADFVPTPAEEQLYEEVSAYLQREVLAALPNTRRKLITLIMRKLLASSSAAIGATLEKFAARLAGRVEEPAEEGLAADFETLDEMKDEWSDETEEAPPAPNESPAPAELADLQRFVTLAKSIERDSKASKLVEVLPRVFELAQEKGAQRKAVIFTESCKTQEYLFRLLNENGYSGQIVLMNGSNNDAVSKRTFADWKKRNEHRWDDVSSGSKTADLKAAIVDEFRDQATILLATESAAEGVNLQFCSIVINYDLPWNPQRIEQRIGRCHRYGQKSDVLVVNFLNRKNEADQRVFELLDQKFNLFKGVFGASDDVLGAVESGVDLEKRIAAIYQECRTPEQIKSAFDALQLELDESIKAGLDSARRAFLENFDAEVHERLRIHKETAKQSLDGQQQMLLDLAKYALADRATFDAAEPRFRVAAEDGVSEQPFHLNWQRAEALGDTFFRVDHPLAQAIIQQTANEDTSPAEVTFFYEPHASALEKYVGTTGWLELSKLTVEAVGRAEEQLLIAACDGSGAAVPPDVAVKLFSLPGVVGQEIDETGPAVLGTIREGLKGVHIAELELRNQSFFQEEVDKLERWAEDLKLTLERQLKDLDAEIKAARKTSKTAVALAEKLEAQKVIKALEAKRSAKRRQLFDAQDDVDKRRAELIDEIERQLKTKMKCETVFTLRWALADTDRA